MVGLDVDADEDAATVSDVTDAGVKVNSLDYSRFLDASGLCVPITFLSLACTDLTWYWGFELDATDESTLLVLFSELN